jgi:hypothetical protein
MVQRFEKLDLPDGGDGEALPLIVHADPLERDLGPAPQVGRQVDLAVRALSNLLFPAIRLLHGAATAKLVVARAAGGQFDAPGWGGRSRRAGSGGRGT